MADERYSPIDDDMQEIVKRYEDFRSGREAAGYFDIDELSDIIDYYLFKGQARKCASVLDLGNHLHPNSDELSIKRAKMLIVTGDYRNAMKILDSITDKDDYEAVLLRTDILARIGRLREAQALASKIFADEVEYIEDAELICQDIATVFLLQNEIKYALKWLKKGEEYNPKNIDILSDMALCYEQQDEYDKAIDIYNRIIEIDPYEGDAWFNLGQVYFLTEQYEKALESYDFAETIDDNDILVSLQRAHVLFQLNRFEEAIEAYQKYGKMTEDKWQVNLFIAECYERMERYDEAMMHYNAATVTYPDCYDAYIGIGVCLYETEHYAESIDYFDKAIDIQEDEPDAWNYLAEALMELEDYDDALLAYTKSLVLNPKQPEILLAVASIFMDKREYEKALELLLAVQEQDYTLENIDLFLAAAYFYTTQVNKGVKHLKIALDKNPNAAELFEEICPDYAWVARG